VVCDETDLVVAVKVALNCPAGTLTEAGTTTLESPLVKYTIAPELGAGPAMAIVPTDV
jgi:hypothetical protein